MASKSILDLCAQLPDSEPELRARKDEFNTEVAVRVMGFPRSEYKTRRPPEGTVLPFDYMDNTQHARKATKAMHARGWVPYVSETVLYVDARLTTTNSVVVARASTEELARSAAACLLAAVKEKP